MTNLLNPIAKPIADVLAAFYAVIPNFGVAILLLSVVWMVVISPLTLKSTRSMLAMQALQPEIQRLKEKHKNDRQAFAQAQMDLMRERNVSPFGACLPTILPMPVFIALFRVIDGLSHHVHGVAVPQYLNQHTAMFKAIQKAGGHINTFGLDLSKNALSHHASVWAALPYFALLLVMMGTQYFQTSMMMNRNAAATANPQMQMMKYLPLVFGIIFIRFPAGVILYYGMSNVCRITQQWAMYRFDPKVKSLVTEEVQELEAKTREIDEEDGRGSSNRRRPAATGDKPSTKAGGSAGKGTAKPSGKTGAETGGKAGARSKPPPAPAPVTGRSRLRELLAGATNPGTTAPGAVGNGTRKPPTGSAGNKGTARGAPTKRSGRGTGGSGAEDGRNGAAAKPVSPESRASGRAKTGAATDRPAKDRPSANGQGGSNGKQGGSNGAPATTDGQGERQSDRNPARTGARTGARPSNPSARAPQPAKPSVGGRNIPARPNRAKRRRKGR